MKKSELPDWVRVKLPEKQTEELWEEMESIKEFAKDSDYSAQQLYNWKNKDLFLPVDLVREVLESFEIVAMKGRNNSNPVENPDFPLELSNELLTRVDVSVYVNEEGTPIYRTQEASLLNRFRQLLDNIGETSFTVYKRPGYELRFPKFLHDLMQKEDFDDDFAARFDEEGKFEEEVMLVDDKSVRIDEFDGKLWNIEKRYKRALILGDSQGLESIFGSQKLKADSLDRTF